MSAQYEGEMSGECDVAKVNCERKVKVNVGNEPSVGERKVKNVALEDVE